MGRGQRVPRLALESVTNFGEEIELGGTGCLFDLVRRAVVCLHHQEEHEPDDNERDDGVDPGAIADGGFLTEMRPTATSNTPPLLMKSLNSCSTMSPFMWVLPGWSPNPDIVCWSVTRHWGILDTVHRNHGRRQIVWRPWSPTKTFAIATQGPQRLSPASAAAGRSVVDA